jgi:predicted dehydrogenase
MPEKYRTCLIGCGRMGATIDDEVAGRPDSFLWIPFSHAAACVACDRIDFVAVSDVVAEKAESIRRRYNVPRCYTDYREMIDKEKPDIVCIATRPATHAEMTVFAAEHGVKGVYCEKPLCCSMEEADAMVQAVEKHGVKFNYGTQRRYMPFYRKMRALIGAGEIGDVQCVIAQYGVGAALWGLTHAADMLLYMAGDPEVDFVQGTIVCKAEDWEGNRLNVDPGIASGYVRFANGVHGYNTAGTGPEFEICGAKGKIRAQNNGMTCQFRKAGAYPRILEEVPFPQVPRESGTVMGIKDIAESLDTGRETLGPIQLARRSQEILMGIIESHRLDGRRVSLPMVNRALYVGPSNW